MRFEKEEKLMEEALGELNELYDEAKGHYDLVKNSGNRSSLSFIHQQLANLVSLKSSKVSVIKELASLKKVDAELSLKENKNESDDDKMNAVIEGVIAKLDLSPASEGAENNIFEDENTEDEFAKLDAMLSKKIKLPEDVRLAQEKSSEELDTENNKKKSNSLLEKCVLKKEKSWEFVYIEPDGNISNKPKPSKKGFKMKIKKIDGIRKAVDQNGTVYRLLVLPTDN